MGIPFHFQKIQTLALARIDTPQAASAPESGEDSVRIVQDKHCGDCHACCVHLPISAGEVSVSAKPAGVDCPHLCQTGCAIYQGRPESCRQFNCAWRVDPSWPLEWRPEQSGLLCLREEIDVGIHAALVYEIEREAIARPTTKPILEKLKESCAVVALVNVRRQRQLLRGRQWVEPAAHGVQRPHFLQSIQSNGSRCSQEFRDAS